MQARGTWHAVAACFLGWTLDAFDFFVVIFMYDHLVRDFRVEKSALLWATTATLAFRPLGALLFGVLADRDRKSTRLNSSHIQKSRMPSSA